jgi:hypothetical protein
MGQVGVEGEESGGEEMLGCEYLEEEGVNVSCGFDVAKAMKYTTATATTTR